MRLPLLLLQFICPGDLEYHPSSTCIPIPLLHKVLRNSTFVSRANVTLSVRSEAATFSKYTHGTRARKGGRRGNLCRAGMKTQQRSAIGRSVSRAGARRAGGGLVNRFRHEKGTERPQQPIILIGFSLSLSLSGFICLRILSLG